jgi:hypothetical protein
VETTAPVLPPVAPTLHWEPPESQGSRDAFCNLGRWMFVAVEVLGTLAGQGGKADGRGQS